MCRKHGGLAVLGFLFLFVLSGISPEPAAAEKTAPAAAKTFVSSLGMKFVYIAPGTFVMGSPKNEKGRERDEIQHQVTLTKGFYMQACEVTVGQWRAFSKATGYKTAAEIEGAMMLKDKEWKVRKGYYWDHPGMPQTDNHPVTCVNWYDIQKFAEWLGEKDGRTYRLPTEAEWEYACRAGTTTRFFWGDAADCSKADFGNSWTNECKRETPIRTVPVASYAPNPWGLYDMHGNVWEWCQDWDSRYTAASVTDPAGPASGEKKVVRGGSWWSYSRFCRSACRVNNDPARSMFTLGFRLVTVP